MCTFFILVKFYFDPLVNTAMTSIFRRYFVKYVFKEEIYSFANNNLKNSRRSYQLLVSNSNFRLWSILSTQHALTPLSKTITTVPSEINQVHDSFDDKITSSDIARLRSEEGGILDPCEEDVSDISPGLPPTYNLAAYANKSHTLQQLIDLGVELHKIEKIKGAAESILKLDFEKDIKYHLRFLHDVGVLADDFGKFITKNPFIFEVSLEDLQIRINYLEAKKFDEHSIVRIITRNPRWLSFSTMEIDKRLGIFQRTFALSGNEVRLLAVKRPSLITYKMDKVLQNEFAMKIDLGFNEVEAKQLLLDAPKLYDIQTSSLKDRFDYVHNIMCISHEQILQQPSVLLFRKFIVKQRHEFLKELGRAQYNPKLPNYISLTTLVRGSDVEFCRDVARTSIDVFNAYLKSC